MALDNYPAGFNPKELDYATVELSEEQRAVTCVLTVQCGEDEETVYTASFASLEDLEESGLRKAQSAIDNWQTKELDNLFDRLRDEAEA